jgi:hypothetical protein
MYDDLGWTELDPALDDDFMTGRGDPFIHEAHCCEKRADLYRG